MGEGGGQIGYEQKIEVIVKIAKKYRGGPFQGWGGGQSGCERRFEVIVKMQKKEEKRVRVGSFLGLGDRKIVGVVKMQEKKSEGEELARVDLNEELNIEVRIDVNIASGTPAHYGLFE